MKVCSITFNILLKNTTITLCGFKHFQNLPCLLQGRLLMNRNPHFCCCIAGFSSSHIQELWSIFRQVNNRFFLTYLAPMSSMVHTDNSLFVPADEDAQHSPGQQKSQRVSPPKGLGKGLDFSHHHSKAAIHLLLNH